MSALPARMLLVAGCLLLANCASFQDVRELEVIQDTPGIYPRALFYSGSDEVCHYFEQESPLGDMTPLSKSVRTFSVARGTVELPEGAEFPRSSYTGKKDERRRMMQIHTDGANSRRARAGYPRYNGEA